MGWKCAPQVVGLVRGEPKASQKHRANGRKIAMEAGYERASRSETLDKARSKQNEYFGYRSGAAFWDDMEREASEYRVKVQGKTKSGEPIIREKGLQHNAVVGWAVIYNPPAEVCANWSQAQYYKFFADCREVMEKISPIFRRENLRMSAIHNDEGIPPVHGQHPDAHVHDLGVCKDENGHYCGNKIDAKLLVTINEKFPQMMRDRGWEMDDLDTTDFERAKIDEDYRVERNAKRKKSGLSVNRHMSRKSHEAQERASELLQTAVQVSDAATERMNLAAELMLEADAQQQYADDQLQRSRQRDALLDQKQNKIFARSKKQDEREKEFQRKEDQLEAQKKVMNEREKQIADREVALAEREQQFAIREVKQREAIRRGQAAQAASITPDTQPSAKPERELPDISNISY